MAAATLWPDTWTAFREQSGRVRTESSADTYGKELRRLQAQHPRKTVRGFTEQDLAAFCLAGTPAASTVAKRRSVLMTVFAWAKWQGLCPTDPAASLKFSAPAHGGPVRTGTWLTEAEIKAVLGSIPDTFAGNRDRIILLFGFLCGLRRSEIAQLEWSQLSPDMSTISFVGKGRVNSTVAVPAQLRSALQQWKASNTAKVMLPGLHYVMDPKGGGRRLVVTDSPLGPDGVAQAVARAGARVGLPLAPHDMRRTYCQLLDNRGIQVTDIARAMRHTNPATTATYLQRNPARTVAVTSNLTIDI